MFALWVIKSKCWKIWKILFFYPIDDRLMAFFGIYRVNLDMVTF